MLGCPCWEEGREPDCGVQSYEFPGGGGGRDAARRGGICPSSPGVQVGFPSFDVAANPLTILAQPQNVQLGKQDEAGARSAPGGQVPGSNS